MKSNIVFFPSGLQFLNLFNIMTTNTSMLYIRYTWLPLSISPIQFLRHTTRFFPRCTSTFISSTSYQRGTAHVLFLYDISARKHKLHHYEKCDAALHINKEFVQIRRLWLCSPSENSEGVNTCINNRRSSSSCHLQKISVITNTCCTQDKVMHREKTGQSQKKKKKSTNYRFLSRIV